MEPQRWTLLIHNIPPKPAYLRNKVANRLAGLGAVALKNSVYLLPDTAAAREGFMWLAQEVETGGGKAFVGEAVFFGERTEEGIRGAFMAAREQAYAPLLEEADLLLEAMAAGGDEAGMEVWRSGMASLRKRADEIRRIDFFHAAGGEALAGKLATMESRLARLLDPARPAAEGGLPGVEAYRNKVWVTRSGVYVDRIASAWLIRRFIDPAAEFRFVEGWEHHPDAGEISYDLPGAVFTHEGEACTFEVLVRRFGLEEGAMVKMAGIIHDLDLRGASHVHPESSGLEALLSGMVMTALGDDERMSRGWAMLDDLFNGIAARMERERAR